MNVLDTSAAIHLLLADRLGAALRTLMGTEAGAAPDVIVFEAISALRRRVRTGETRADRAAAAIADLADAPIEIFPSLPLRVRAWELRENFGAADALFVALAERVGEPLVTRDRRLIEATRAHSGIEVIELAA